MPQIEVDCLTKDYRVHHRLPGLRNSFRALFKRDYELVHAVDNVSFTVEEGEIIGFLGPNGAGKSTTLKLLSGLLYPTAGRVNVMGFTPSQRRRDYLRQITLVMGQRNQLLWDLPAMESLLVNKAIYKVPTRQFGEALEELVELLDLESLLSKQVRKLSLGERLKCEIAASLIHWPKLLFLDEPTLGLDVPSQVAIREFIGAYSRRRRATVLLSSHYMDDVTALASRVLIINQGKIVYDGTVERLVEHVAPYKRIRLILSRPVARSDLDALGAVESINGLDITLRAYRETITETAAEALRRLPVVDLAIQDETLDQVILDLFKNLPN